MGKTDLNNLGQYFTPENIAKYMVSEVLSRTKPQGKILDPCVGKNIFFSNINDPKLILQGVEIDETLIDKNTLSYYEASNRNLIIGDFIDQEFLNDFDSVIMNPPYIRQEKVLPETKTKLKKISDSLGVDISSKSNLYIYFILKGIMLLKDNGTLVAITYDSWLYSSFGSKFKRFIVDNHDLEKIIHFKHDAFEGVDVGATVLVIKKGTKTEETEYIEYESAKDFVPDNVSDNTHLLSPEDLIHFNEHTLHKNALELPQSIFTTLDSVSSETPWRGASSAANKFFLFKEYDPYLLPVIKKTPLNSYYVTEQNAHFALSIGVNEDRDDVIARLKDIKSQLQATGSDSIKEKLENDPFWYKFNLKKGGEIIFNYYFRDNPRFVLNEDRVATMGNYYNIHCADTMFETFALLNSSLSRYALLRNSKNQGKGLRKIQLYKFNKVPVLPLSVFNLKEIELLRKLGKALKINPDVIDEINELVLGKYCQLVKTDYNKTKKLIEMETKK